MKLPYLTSSFKETIKNISSGIRVFKPLKSLWYPACGWDFRVLHHLSTNNDLVESDFFIFSDMNNWEENLKEGIEQVNGFSVLNSRQIRFRDLPEGVVCYYKLIEFNVDNVQLKKNCLFIWGVTNEYLIEVFRSFEIIKLESIFVRKCSDESVTENIADLMEAFKCSYYLTDLRHTGLPEESDYQEAIEYARANNLSFHAITGYGNIGNNNSESLDFVYTFKK